MSKTVIVGGSIGLFILFLCAAIVLIFVEWVRHNPERAGASVAVTADVPFELPPPRRRGGVFFRFEIADDTKTPGYDTDVMGLAPDFLVSGEIVDELGGTRAFAMRTAERSKIEGANSAQKSGMTHAMTSKAGSIKLATVYTRDRVVRCVVREHPKGLLRKGWVYIPGGRR